jgi:hypothetical protein
MTIIAAAVVPLALVEAAAPVAVARARVGGRHVRFDGHGRGAGAALRLSGGL